MTNLQCSEHDCCNNKFGCCCLDTISVEDGGMQSEDAVCGSYCADSGYGNDIGGESAVPETEIRCKEGCCCHNDDGCCCAERVDIEECSCGPECKTFCKE